MLKHRLKLLLFWYPFNFPFRETIHTSHTEALIYYEDLCRCHRILECMWTVALSDQTIASLALHIGTFSGSSDRA